MKDNTHPHLKRKLPHIRLSQLSLVLFVLLFAVIGAYLIFRGHALTGPAPNPLLNPGVPTYTNGGNYSGGSVNAANDGDYGTQLCSPTQPVTASSPFYVAYDLSAVPAAHRGQVIAISYSNTYPFDLSYFNDIAYSVPADWTIDVNAAAGGSYPTSGWVTLATVANNTWGTRQSVVNMTGYKWIRINVTGNLGSGSNNGACINEFDIHDASSGVSDDWMFFGDSITANTMDPDSNPMFAQLINQSAPAYFPVDEPGGIAYLTSSDGAAHLATWLQNFPGKYVGLSYGTNDAAANFTPQTFYNNYVTMIQDVLSLGKIPVIPTIPWRCDSTSNVQAYNQQIQTLYTQYPQIIKGPDLYAFFYANQSYISGNDCIHPNDAGNTQYRQLWANAMLANVYNAPTTDNTAPSVPTNLQSTSTTTTSVSLSWGASTDNSGGSGLAGYRVYRNGTLAGTVTAGTLTFTDSALSPATSYSYSVSAYDNAGNESAQSAAVNVTTTSGVAPVLGDCNGDGHVTIIDLSMLLSHYGSAYAACDFNSDGIVNVLDLSILLSHYGT